MDKTISTQFKKIKSIISLPKKAVRRINRILFFFKQKAGLILLYLKKINFREILSVLRNRKPTWRQWLLLPKSLTSCERWMVRIFTAIIIISIASLLFNNYLIHTQTEPKLGGTYKEGIVGQPRYINPILAQTNDIDRDLVQLTFSGLFKYDSQGNLIPDLAEKYTIEDDDKTYHIYLKKNIFWHDNEPLTADDVIFTIKTIQNAEYKSPLKIKWQGVEVEKIDNLTIRFKLKNTYAPFLYNLTVGILPRHRWAGIPASDFPLAEYNLKPIGCGPYQFKKFTKDKSGRIQSIELIRNENFHLSTGKEGNKNPFIEKIILKFYKDQDELTSAYQKRAIDGLNFVSAANLEEFGSSLNVYQIDLPIYYAIFFNQTESKVLADKNVRLALSHATNKQEIIEKVLRGKGFVVDSPFLPGWLGHNSEIDTYEFNPEKAKEILENNGWKDENNDGVREKSDSDNEEENKLEVSILTTNWPELNQTAQIIKEQWERIGVKINLETINPISIQQDYIRPREYQSLLFGEILGADPDPFAFWHSSQRKDPGLNLALYQNREADKLLEEARQTLNQEERIQKYTEFQKKLAEDIPAIFLYSSTYLYPVSKKVKGISIEKISIPSQRFSQIENWYIKTRRVEKQ